MNLHRTSQHAAHQVSHLLKISLAFALVFTFVFVSSPAHALKVGDVEMPDSLENGAASMELNGAGKRTKLVAKLYVAGLYLGSPVSGAENIVASEQPMAIRLQITSSLINAKRMEKATREGFENAAGKDLPKISDRVDEMIGVFNSGVADGDIYEFMWVPGAGTRIVKNGTEAAVIDGLDFKQALFAIWLGAKPAQKSLKADLLGE